MTGPAIRCALCGTGMDRWYWGGHAPLCAWCADREGPVLPPARWEPDARRVSPAARQVWEIWARAGAR